MDNNGPRYTIRVETLVDDASFRHAEGAHAKLMAGEQKQIDLLREQTAAINEQIKAIDAQAAKAKAKAEQDQRDYQEWQRQHEDSVKRYADAAAARKEQEEIDTFLGRSTSQMGGAATMGATDAYHPRRDELNAINARTPGDLRAILGRSTAAPDAATLARKAAIADAEAEMRMQKLFAQIAKSAQPETAPSGGGGLFGGLLDTGALNALLTGGLPSLIAKLGAVGAAFFAVKQAWGMGWQTMRENNDDFAKAWDNFTATLSSNFAETIRDVTGNGESLTTFFDDLTKMMGGTTEAEKKLTAKMEGLISLAPKHNDAVESMRLKLEGYAKEADAAAQKLEGLNKVVTAGINVAREDEDIRRKGQRDKIANDSTLSPEERDARLKGFDRESAALNRSRKQEDIDAERDKATKAKALRDQEAKKIEDAVKQRDEESRRVNAFQTAKVKEAQAKSDFDRAKEQAQTYYGDDGTPIKATPEEIADFKRRDEELKAAQKARKEAKDQLPKGYTGNDGEKEKAEEAARIARDALKKKLAENAKADEQDSQADTARIAEEQRMNLARKREQEQDDEAAKKKAEDADKAFQPTGKELDLDAQIAAARQRLKELQGKQGEAVSEQQRKAIMEAQRDYNAAVRAKADYQNSRQPAQTELDDDIAGYDENGEPVYYSDFASPEQAEQKVVTPPEEKPARSARKEPRNRSSGSGQGADFSPAFSGMAPRGNWRTPPSMSARSGGASIAAGASSTTMPANMAGTRALADGEEAVTGPTSNMWQPPTEPLAKVGDIIASLMHGMGNLAGTLDQLHSQTKSTLDRTLANMRSMTAQQIDHHKQLTIVGTKIAAIRADEPVSA